MKRTKISEVKKGENVILEGFIHSLRKQSNIIFVELRDVSGTIQIVVPKESNAFKQKENFKVESIIVVEGVAKESRSNIYSIEVEASEIRILSSFEERLPIQVNEKGENEAELEQRMNYRWLDLRKPEKQLIFKVWTEMESTFVNYLSENGFIRIHSPKLLGAPSESGAELFELEYFGRKAYLAQSPQFYKQMAMSAGFEKVFEIGPVFRANPSFTVRHDTEFTGYDFEFSYIESHYDVMELQEKLLIAMIRAVKEKYGKEIKEYYGRELSVPSHNFPKVSMQEAKEILKSLGVKSEKEGDLSPEEERELCKHMNEKTGHEFVFVTEYPYEVRPFYHMKSEENPKLTKSYDLLWNGHEITTGAQREHRYEVLVEQAKEKGVGLESINFYLDFFKFGCPPHGGCGMGPTRMLMKIFNIQNVREVTFLYRGPKRLTP